MDISLGATTASALSVDQHNMFSVGRARLLRRSPYLSAMVYRLRPYVADQNPYTHILKNGRIFLTEEVLTCDVLIAETLEHCAWHLLRNHHERVGTLLGNFCACLEINDDIKQQPQASDFGLPNFSSLEQYHFDFSNRQGGDAFTAVDLGLDITIEPDDQDLTDDDLMQAANSVAQDIARMPDASDGLKRWADDQLGESKVPWQQELLGLAGDISTESRNRSDISYRRPSRRRRDDGIIRPSYIGEVPTIDIVIDTSGSMNTSDLTDALTETQAILSQVCTVNVWACDTEAVGGDRVTSIQDVNLQGGGGTDMIAGIAAAIAKNNPHLIIVITDGECSWHLPEQVTPLVAVITKRGTVQGIPSWIRVIKVD